MIFSNFLHTMDRKSKRLASKFTSNSDQNLDKIRQKIAPQIDLEWANEADLAGCLIVWLNRPDKKNALTFAMMQNLLDLALWIKKNRQVRAVILTGRGTSFCAGIDLGDLNDGQNQAFAFWQLIKPYQSLFQAVCLVWRDLPVPVLVALEGHCLGAGLQLALGADVRFATPDCQFAIMESRWGLVADMGLTQSALGQVAIDALKELAMTAKIIDAKTAHAMHLISHVSADPLAQAKQLAGEICQRSPDAVLASKRLINQMYHQKSSTLYQEKLWQIKLLLGKNRKIALKKAKNAAEKFNPRQF